MAYSLSHFLFKHKKRDRWQKTSKWDDVYFWNFIFILHTLMIRTESDIYVTDGLVGKPS